jgi:hypothetical protein
MPEALRLSSFRRWRELVAVPFDSSSRSGHSALVVLAPRAVSLVLLRQHSCGGVSAHLLRGLSFEFHSHPFQGHIPVQAVRRTDDALRSAFRPGRFTQTALERHRDSCAVRRAERCRVDCIGQRRFMSERFMPNQITGANSRPASPLDAGRQFGCAACAPPFLPAAVAQF